jgi:hypothetical protein
MALTQATTVGTQLVRHRTPGGQDLMLFEYHNKQVLLDAWLQGKTTDREKFDALVAAMSYCETNKTDLVAAGNITIPILETLQWDSRSYSFRGEGRVILDCTKLSPGGYGMAVKQVHNGTDLWYNITHKLSGIIFLGNEGVNGLKIDSILERSQAMNLFEGLYFNMFNIGAYLGNNQWLNRFHHCGWRNCTYKIEIHALEDSGENIQFLGCDFFGQNSTQTDVCINHVEGNIEITFDGCSFDFMSKTLHAHWNQGRGIMRFVSCHFENRGMLDFDVDSGSEWYRIVLDKCDWTWDATTMPVRIGTFTCTNVLRPVVVTITGCNFNSGKNFDLEGRELFTCLGETLLQASGNNVISNRGRQGIILSRAARFTPFFTKAALDSNTIEMAGGGTVALSTDFPTSHRLFGDAMSLSGNVSIWSKSRVVGGERITFAGHIKRSRSDIQTQVRFLDINGNVLSSASTQVDGDVGSWGVFCQQYIVPRDASYVRMQCNCTTQLITESTILHSWMIERH